MTEVEYVEGSTWHGRTGGLENSFEYKVGFVLLNLEEVTKGPAFFSRRSGKFFGILDSDYGGPPGAGRSSEWVREVLESHRLKGVGKILLLAQPRIFGHVFNPVSFWLCYSKNENLLAVISEVTNTYGDRHWYISYNDDKSEISSQNRLLAKKIFHVSPFQPIEGQYEFRFDIREDKIAIWIDLNYMNGGIKTNLIGTRSKLTNLGIIGSVMSRPLGSRRVLGLIHWQALKLWFKGARYRTRPEPPEVDVSQ